MVTLLMVPDLVDLIRNKYIYQKVLIPLYVQNFIFVGFEPVSLEECYQSSRLRTHFRSSSAKLFYYAAHLIILKSFSSFFIICLSFTPTIIVRDKIYYLLPYTLAPLIYFAVLSENAPLSKIEFFFQQPW